MRYIVVRDDADRATLEAAISALRTKQRACVTAEVAGCVAAEIDRLIDRWASVS